MRKVYENFEFAYVGHYQSILEANGIATLVRNLGSEMATGIPIPGNFPELWVLEDSDFERAVELMEEYKPSDSTELKDWTCPKCSEAIEKQFSECWNCGSGRPGFEAVEEPES